MKKQLALWILFAFTFSFLCACSAVTPGPSTTRSQAAPMTVPTTAAPETETETQTTEKETEQYSTWAGVTHDETDTLPDVEEVTGEILYVKSGVNVRQGPNKNTTVLGTLSSGDTVEKVGQEGKWVEIKYNDGTAYVFEDYLESR